jgi:hypothetical protein
MDLSAPESKPPALPGLTLDGSALSLPKSTRSARRSSKRDIQKSQTSEMSQRSEMYLQSTSWLEEHRASRSASRALGLEPTTIVEFLFSTSLEWLKEQILQSWFGKTSPVSCHREEDGTLVPSLGGWKNSGMGGPIGRLTLDFSEAPTTVVESSLSDVLEDDSTWPPERFLSLSTQSKILGRLAKYGKPVPEGAGLPVIPAGDSVETKPQNSFLMQAPHYEHPREEKETSCGGTRANGTGEDRLASLSASESWVFRTATQPLNTKESQPQTQREGTR